MCWRTAGINTASCVVKASSTNNKLNKQEEREMHAQESNRSHTGRITHLVAGLALCIGVGLAGAGAVSATPGAGAYAIQGATEEGSLVEPAAVRGGARRGGAAVRGGGVVRG